MTTTKYDLCRWCERNLANLKKEDDIKFYIYTKKQYGLEAADWVAYDQERRYNFWFTAAMFTMFTTIICFIFVLF